MHLASTFVGVLLDTVGNADALMSILSIPPSAMTDALAEEETYDECSVYESDSH